MTLAAPPAPSTQAPSTQAPARSGGVGRLAPSPTGALHVGNAFALALAAAHAHSTGARLVLRHEDLDRARVVPGAMARIEDDLRWLGVRWEGVPLVQSTDPTPYARALDILATAGLLYACACSRRDLALAAERAGAAPHAGDDGPVYPGTCRHLGIPLDAPDVALRVRADLLQARFGMQRVEDLWQGTFSQDVAQAVGDFVVRRRDGVPAYQLAVVVDDLRQGVTQVVRGVDLLASTPRQRLLWAALAPAACTPPPAPPSTAHLPLLVDSAGERLAKRSPEAPALLATLRDAGVGAGALLSHFLMFLDHEDAAPRLVEALDLATFAERVAANPGALARGQVRWRAPALSKA